MKKNQFKILSILTPIVILTIILILLTLFQNFRTVKYYKCPEKPPADLLQSILDKHRFVNDPSISNLYMPCGYNDVEDELEMLSLKNSKYIFGLKGCDQIVSKNNLWEILETTFGRVGASRIMPESFLIDDINQFNLARKKIKEGHILICKKNLQRKLGLTLVFTEEELLKAKTEDFLVAQIFLQNTKQIKQRKMNIRIYFAIKKTGNQIEFFINKNGKILYTKNKTLGPVSFESHITSYQMDPELYEKEDIPHNLAELAIFLGPQEFNIIWKKILMKIKYFSNAIAYVFNDPKFNDKVCFQLFGIDVILDGNEPYILEVNKGPDMIPKTNKDIGLKGLIYEELFNLAGLIYRPFKKNNFVQIYSEQFT